MADILECNFDDMSHRLAEMIKNKESFVLRGLSSRIIKVTSEVERVIEVQGMTCRIYSRNRVAVMAASTFVPFLGWANLAVVAAHNLATWNPDYEIGKDLTHNKLYVTYKK